jgi:dihydrodipicolinate synthase/N-acetylneuraminate lyase
VYTHPQAAALQRQKVQYILVAGTTGESLKLSTDERLRLTEEWFKVAPTYDIKVFVHVGHENIREVHLGKMNFARFL